MPQLAWDSKWLIAPSADKKQNRKLSKAKISFKKWATSLFRHFQSAIPAGLAETWMFCYLWYIGGCFVCYHHWRWGLTALWTRGENSCKKQKRPFLFPQKMRSNSWAQLLKYISIIINQFWSYLRLVQHHERQRFCLAMEAIWSWRGFLGGRMQSQRWRSLVAM